MGVLDKSLVPDHVQHSDAGGARDGVAPKGGEEAHLGGKMVEDLLPGDHHAEGMAVAGGFTEGDDVWHDAVALMAPQRGAGASKAGLHLVGDEEAASSADLAADELEVGAGGGGGAAEPEKGGNHSAS